MKKLLSIVIPVFNEESNIGVLVQRLNEVRCGLDVDSEVVLVDDHSSDASQELLLSVCRQNAGYRYIRLSKNQGSHIAVLAGLKNARGDCAVFLASDLQDPPELLSALLDEWGAGKQVVWAVREAREGQSRLSLLLSNSFWMLLNRYAEVEVPPSGCDFALLDRRAIDALSQSVRSNPSIALEIANLGFRQGHVGYVKQIRNSGESKWNLERKLKAFADAFVAFSYKPLRLMSYVGMTFSVVGCLYAIYIIAARLINQSPVVGWASLMVVTLILGGVQMTMLGVIGEYLWRTRDLSAHRPLFHVEYDSQESSESSDPAPRSERRR